ncbi:hypothetical protein IWQ60_011583 [Tieghemiomyces parasiticus]|uniref:Major facilitator superfamily (MFS) profile domain-containing protein n=1 Tax=Tieghemiomyces parasiticus TaxID=78921 RepID=A0A9W7ZIB9_9FUNG|nr:hypothetical protein IWQ60_011583 [Tieghemiomyces parasiticus]
MSSDQPSSVSSAVTAEGNAGYVPEYRIKHETDAGYQAVGEKAFEVPAPASETSTFSPKDTRRLVRKIDWHLLPLICIVYIFCFLDRSNIGNAKLYHFKEDLNLSQADYSWALSIFYLGYVLLEVPSNLMIKRVRPSLWLAIIIATWGTLSMCMAANSGVASLLTIRILLGMAEAGFFPGVVFFFTFWYNNVEIATRVAIFYSAASIAGAVGGLLAYGIGHIDGHSGLSAWQWLFIIEGIPTVILAAIIYFCLADNPISARWLTPEERIHAVERLESSKIVEKHIHHVDWKEVRESFTDPTVYLHCLIHIALVVPAYGMSFLLPTVINALGYNALNSQLLTVPLYVFSALFGVFNAFISDRLRQRAYFNILPSVMAFIGFVLVAFLKDTVAKYVLLLLVIAGSNGSAAINVAWVSNNTLGKTKTGVTTGFVLMVGNAGGVISGQMYRSSEAPDYIGSHMGNAACLAIIVVASLLARYSYVRKNRDLDAFRQRADENPAIWEDPANVPQVLQIDRDFRYTL